MNALLDRLDAVQVDAISMISDYDKSICEQYQSKFKDFVKFAEKYNRFIDRQGVDGGDLGIDYQFNSPDQMKKKMNEQVENATKHFIDHLVWHFQRNYNVSIDSYSIKEKYDHTVTYEDVVREIAEQLGGLNFEERAVQEIKEKIQGRLKHGYANYEVTRKNAKLTIGSGFIYWTNQWCSTGCYQPSSHDCTDQRALFTALSHFERGSTDMLNCFSYLCQHDERSTWFDKDEFEFLNKVKSSKFYKNGKVDIEFASPELAQQFAREYLNREV